MYHSRQYNDESYATHLQSCQQDKVEKQLAAIEGSKARMYRNFTGDETASNSSSTETYRGRYCDTSESSSSAMSFNSITSYGRFQETGGPRRMNETFERRRLANPIAMSLLPGDLLPRDKFEFQGNYTQHTNDSLYAKRLSRQDNEGISLHHEYKNQLEGRKSGLPGTMFAGTSEDIMDGKDTFKSSTKTEENKTYTVENRNADNVNIPMYGKDFARSLSGLTIPQEEEDTNHSASPIASNDTSASDASTNNVPPIFAFANNEMLVSMLLKQLSESYFTRPSTEFYHPSFLSNILDVSGNNVSSQDFLLPSASLLLQILHQQQKNHQQKVSNSCSTIPEYQQLPDELQNWISSVLSQEINAQLDEEHHHAMLTYQQMQNQINDLHENIKRIMEGFRLHQDQRRKHRNNEKQFRRKQRKRIKSSNSTDQPQDAQKNPSKRKSSSHVEHNCSGKNHIEERKERKKKRKRRHNKTTTDLDDDSTIKTSSPRLESAFKRFNAKFDEFTLSCMEQVGYTGEECGELLPTFQNEVIRESRYRKSWKS